MNSTFLIIDGFALVFRAYYALPTSLSLPSGQPINAVYGLVTQTLRAIDLVKPTHLCICLDRPEPTFREALFNDYKANRPDPPDDLVSQFPLIQPLLDELGIPCLTQAGFEADDLIGTLAKSANQESINALILSGDMDLLQLVTDSTQVLMPGKHGQEFNQMDGASVFEKYGITPLQVIDYKALKGDPSDNIPGVKGIGDKTAVKLLTEFNTLEGIYNNLDFIQSKSIREKLEANKEMANLSYQLATIKTDVDISKPISDFAFEANWKQILQCFHHNQFNSLIKRYQSKLDQPLDSMPLSHLSKPSGSYRLITGLATLKKMIPSLQDGFAIDLETTSLDVQSAQIVGVSLSNKSGEAVYIAMNEYLQERAVSHNEFPLFVDDQFDRESCVSNPLLDVLKPVLEDHSIPKYTHNGKYEYMMLRQYGIQLNNIHFDTMIAGFLLYPGEKIGLKDLAKSQLSIDMTAFEDIVAKDASFDTVDLNTATNYAAADADITYQLMELFTPLIEKHNLTSLLTDIEMPLISVLADMELEGVCIDEAYLDQLSREYVAELNELETDIHSLAGRVFNVKSTKQLASVLFDELQLPIIKKTKTGPSTNASVLEKLTDNHPIIPKLLRYRSLEKLLSTYIKALPLLVSVATKRIHTSFNQTIALTGRLSSTQPNLQNIPIRTTDGLKIRQAFIPSHPNHTILSADYSQIELRILAHLSQDPELIKAYQNQDDIHTNTASLVFGIPVSAVTKQQRYFAKSINFGIIYGQSAYGLSEQLSISPKEAKEIIDSYFETFPKIKLFMSETIEESRKTGVVCTEYGRIRPLSDINSKNGARRQYAERIAVNTRIQGTAADIMKIAMIRIHKAMAGMTSKLLIQVHDELVFDIDPSESDQMLKLVKEHMTQAANLNVPLEVDAVFGKNWQDIS